MREQLWILPSGDPNLSLRATVFRPDDGAGFTGPRPLVVINHGTDEATRLAVAMPIYYWMSRWFVDRGYVVVLPQRRGHGATGGALVESIGTCDRPDHFASGNVAADDIEAVVEYLTKEPFVASKGAVVVGVSTGGWASLALAGRNLPQVEAVVNFAGGRGGHAYGRANAVCGVEELLSAAQSYAHHSHVPTIWFYSENDSYFGPRLAKSLAQVWGNAGGQVEEHILPPYGRDGHTIADDRRGWDIWGARLASFLGRVQQGSGDTLHMAAQPGSAKTEKSKASGAASATQAAMIETSATNATTK
ncbi:alpha/beta hydrolase family protein [Hyphomicrobium methylovorum]|uniref:alpha/beta hydrolase family protein n=1 Tax=Hyphomicrobium methylovorum TaxID=84 RepID=UPI001FE5095E|nr:prolyl oligopeptidase family serine peptidase [Hyphomicrobium methylovorum]